MFDLIIKNGLVADGSGKPVQKLDLGIKGSEICALADLAEAEAGSVIDAAGRIVCPGFIDAHSHADFTLPSGPTADSLLMQGVTTVISGQCGISSAPLLDETRQEVIALQGSELYPQPWHEWTDFASYLGFLERLRPAVNVASLVGQGTIRAAAMGYSDAPPNSSQLKQMQRLAHDAMSAGAFGISTGLSYSPGSYASTEELIEVTKPVGEMGGFYFTHLRSEEDSLLEAVQEAIRIGRESGAKVQISHLKAAWPDNWPQAALALQAIDTANKNGIKVAADMYPYTAASQPLISLLPLWAQSGGKQDTLSRLGDKVTRQKIQDSMKELSPCRFVDWQRVMISGSPLAPEYQGKYVSDLAAGHDQDPFNWVCDALIKTGLDMMMIMFISSEDNLRRILRHKAVMIGTDGTGVADQECLLRANIHPRNYGAFARILGRYVRDEQVLGLEEVVHKMTGQPAEWFGLSKRGMIKPGHKADLVILNPDKVGDLATFEKPHQYPAGIAHVLVNGEIVVHHGLATHKRPGRILRPDG